VATCVSVVFRSRISKNLRLAYSSKVCNRALVKILTKSTITSEKLLRSDQARYAMSIIESELGIKDDELHEDSNLPVVTVAVCYVDASTGSVTVREFQDDFRRTETERLLTNIRPLEIIIDPNQLPNFLTPYLRSRNTTICAPTSPKENLVLVHLMRCCSI